MSLGLNELIKISDLSSCFVFLKILYIVKSCICNTNGCLSWKVTSLGLEAWGLFHYRFRALQNNLAKIYNARNDIYVENFKVKLCMRAQSMALGTCTNFGRIFWRARETLVKQPPGSMLNAPLINQSTDQAFCPACRTSLIATRFWVIMICPIIKCLTVLRVFFYFVWFVFIHHNFQFYFELCTYCNILDIYLSQNLNFGIYLLFYMKLLNYLFFNMFGSVLECCELTGVSLL